MDRQSVILSTKKIFIHVFRQDSWQFRFSEGILTAVKISSVK